MKRTFFLLCLIIGISGCSINSDTTDNSKKSIPTNTSAVLLENYEANSIEWHDDDLLVYHAKDGLYAYLPSDGIRKKLLSEELTGNNWVIHDLNSRYYSSSPDKSKYILSTGKRKILQIREANTDRIILSLNYPNDDILEAGWFDNENVFLTTIYSLYIVNILSCEKVQITEDSFDIFSQPGISDEYILWARNVNKIGDMLYYNGVRSTTDQISSTIYRGDKSGEQKLLEKAMLLKAVDNGRFVYLKQSNDEYEGTFLYNIQTGESSLITKEDLRNTGGIFLTNDSKLAFVTKKTESASYYGVIFDPVTLQSQEFEILKQNLSDTDKINYFGQFMGAFQKDGAFIFLFTVRSTIERNQKTFSYNSKTDRLTEVAGYEGKNGINMQISPSGKYIAVNEYNFFDVVYSDNL